MAPHLLDSIWKSALSPEPVPILDGYDYRDAIEFPVLKNAGLLLQLPATRHVICPGCEQHSEEVIPIRYPDGSLRFFVPCPESGREEVSPEQLVQRGVHFGAIPGFLARAMGLPKATCHVQDKLWHLGQYGAIAGYCDIWLGRWLDWHENAALLRKVPQSPRTVLLYLGKVPDYSVIDGIPHQNILPVSDLIRIEARGLALRSDPLLTTLARVSAGTVSIAEDYVFRNEGDVWRLVYDGKTALRKHSIGMRYLQHLLEHPGDCFVATTLRKLTHPDYWEVITDKSLQDLIDSRAFREYLERLHDLPGEIEAAHNNNEVERAALLHEEREALLGLMRKDTRFGRHIRTFVSETQKLHFSLAKSIHRSVQGIQDKHFALWRHLNNHIKIRNSFTYLPENAVRWRT